MAELPLAGGWLRFERLGAGPHLVLLHGLLGSAAQWRPAAIGLAEHYTCWLLELPGISSSDSLADLSLPGLRGWLEQALGALGLDRFALIGSSWGGALALEYATASPGRAQLDRLVLVAPAHPVWTPNRLQRWMLHPAATRAAAWGGARLPRAAHRLLLARMYGDPARMAAESVDLYRTIFRQPGLGAAAAGYSRNWQRDQHALRAHLAQAPPALLLWGDRDAVVPVRTAAALRAALPQAELRVLPGLGHIPFAEDPAAFNAALLPYLRL